MTTYSVIYLWFEDKKGKSRRELSVDVVLTVSTCLFVVCTLPILV